MLSSVIEARRGVLGAYVHPELTGRRVLVTGVSATRGVDVVRAFADHGCRLVLQIAEPTPETDALLEVLSETAEEIAVGHASIEDADGAVRFAQLASKAYGGLDVVVNLIPFGGADVASARTVAEVERVISQRLDGVMQSTRVVANRMGLTWARGVVINVLIPDQTASTGAQAMGAIARGALAAATRLEAIYWADQGVRINAIATCQIGRLSGQATAGAMESGAAALALFLSSNRGKDVSGLVLDPEADVNGF